MQLSNDDAKGRIIPGKTSADVLVKPFWPLDSHGSCTSASAGALTGPPFPLSGLDRLLFSGPGWRNDFSLVQAFGAGSVAYPGRISLSCSKHPRRACLHATSIVTVPVSVRMNPSHPGWGLLILDRISPAGWCSLPFEHRGTKLPHRLDCPSSPPQETSRLACALVSSRTCSLLFPWTYLTCTPFSRTPETKVDRVGRPTFIYRNYSFSARTAWTDRYCDPLPAARVLCAIPDRML